MGWNHTAERTEKVLLGSRYFMEAKIRENPGDLWNLASLRSMVRERSMK